MSMSQRFSMAMAMAMIFCGALGACTTTPEAETASASEGALTSDPSSEAQVSGGSGRQISLRDMERANLEDGQSQLTAECVFVEWCNRPASISPDIGTVCRVRPGCALDQAAVDECVRDTNAVCGAPVQPWWICPQGVACP